MNRAVQFVKRTIDICAGVLGVIFFLLVSPFIGVAIYLESPGAILIRQRRAGRLRARASGGNQLQYAELTIVKFRTMHVDAERFSGVVFAGAADPRITRLGRFLRRTHLDELPQFFNVLSGRMSLVGPRPERSELQQVLIQLISRFEDRMRGVKPGLTGLAQVGLPFNTSASEVGMGLVAGLSLPLRRLPPDGLVFLHEYALPNHYRMQDAEGSIADDMRLRLLYDLTYAECLKSMPEYLRTEVTIILKTPIVMIQRLLS